VKSGGRLMLNPKLLLLDEPSEGIGADHRAGIIAVLKRLKGRALASCWSSRTCAPRSRRRPPSRHEQRAEIWLSPAVRRNFEGNEFVLREYLRCELSCSAKGGASRITVRRCRYWIIRPFADDEQAAKLTTAAARRCGVHARDRRIRVKPLEPRIDFAREHPDAVHGSSCSRKPACP